MQMEEHNGVVLEATGLVKKFPGVEALKGISLAVRRGETISIIGPNLLRLPLTVPLRWTRIWAWDWRLGGARVLTLDAFAALLACLASSVGLTGFLILVSGLLLLRQIFFLHVWLANQAVAGSRWPRKIAIGFLIPYLVACLIEWRLGASSMGPTAVSDRLLVAVAFLVETSVVLFITLVLTLISARKTGDGVCRPLALTPEELRIISE